MNKKLLLFTLMALLLCIMVPSAMAKTIGPQKAVGKNPHIPEATPEGVEALLPSGGFHSWTADTEFWYMDFEHGIDASKAKGLIHKATTITFLDIIEVMTDPEAALEAVNKWFYMSNEVLVEMMINLGGLTPEEAEAMAAMWPEGIYVRFVNVGK